MGVSAATGVADVLDSDMVRQGEMIDRVGRFVLNATAWSAVCGVSHV